MPDGVEGHGDYNWRDERVGLWSDVTFEPNAIKFVPRGNHQRGRYLALAVLAFAVVFFAAPLIRNGLSPGQLIVGAALAIVLGGLGWQVCNRQAKPVIVTLKTAADASDPEPASGIAIPAPKVLAIIARENEGRYSDDIPCAQIYLQIDGREQPMVVHQQSLASAKQVSELAQRIANLLGVRLVDAL